MTAAVGRKRRGVIDGVSAKQRQGVPEPDNLI
jgi:hypothetical protein